MIKQTMLTHRTLSRFEKEYHTEQYTPEQEETIARDAYIAHMNKSANPHWTDGVIDMMFGENREGRSTDEFIEDFTPEFIEEYKEDFIMDRFEEER